MSWTRNTARKGFHLLSQDDQGPDNIQPEESAPRIHQEVLFFQGLHHMLNIDDQSAYNGFLLNGL